MAQTSKLRKGWVLAAVFAGMVAYLALWPIPAQPVAWEAAAALPVGVKRGTGG